MRSFVLGKKENIKKDSYIWNTIGGLINAFQSVIILMVLTRSLDMEYAGIFTIAVNTGLLSDELLMDAGASLLFHSMTELLDNLPEIIHLTDTIRI